MCFDLSCKILKKNEKIVGMPLWSRDFRDVSQLEVNQGGSVVFYVVEEVAEVRVAMRPESGEDWAMEVMCASQFSSRGYAGVERKVPGLKQLREGDSRSLFEPHRVIWPNACSQSPFMEEKE